MPSNHSQQSTYKHPTGDTSVSTKPLASTYSRRNFEQIIRTFSKVTGVHQSRRQIRVEVEAIRAQLPLNFDSASHNAFNQIAITTLALRYCREFVNDNTTNNGNTILGIASTDPLMKEKIATELINRFAYTDASDDPFLANVKQELISSLTYENSIFTTNMRWYDTNVVVACSVFLASSYFTLD